MLQRIYITFSTFVLCATVAHAAPQGPTPDLDDNPQPVETTNVKKDELKAMDISEPPREAQRKTRGPLENEYFYPYQSSMGPRLGILLNSERLQNKELLYLLGFYYMLPSISSRHLEVGADLQSNQVGTINALIKWIYNSTGSFRPFTKAGLSLLIEPDKGLANTIDYKQYSVRLAVGIEDVLKDPASLRWDLEVTAGIKEISVNIVFGYSWGW